MRDSWPVLDLTSETNHWPTYKKVSSGVPVPPGLALGKLFVLNMKHERGQLVVRKKPADNKEKLERYRQDWLSLKPRTQVARLSDNLGDSLPEDVKAIFQALYDQLLGWLNSLGREESQKNTPTFGTPPSSFKVM